MKVQHNADSLNITRDKMKQVRKNHKPKQKRKKPQENRKKSTEISKIIAGNVATSEEKEIQQDQLTTEIN